METQPTEFAFLEELNLLPEISEIVKKIIKESNPGKDVNKASKMALVELETVFKKLCEDPGVNEDFHNPAFKGLLLKMINDNYLNLIKIKDKHIPITLAQLN